MRELTTLGSIKRATPRCATSGPRLPACLERISALNPRRVEAAGAGIALPAPDRASLRAAMTQVLTSTDIRSAARRISEEIACLPTVADAVAEFEGIGSN